MFDDHCCEITGAGQFLSAPAPSRGLVLKLNTAARTVTPVATYSHGKGFESEYMGNLQLLPDGDAIVGWGDVPYISEYSAGGKLLFDASFPSPDMSYRTYLQQWVGLPLTLPSGAARRDGGHTTVYASWNGATQVRAWRVLGLTAAGQTGRLAQSARSGFETSITVTSSDQRFRLQALNAAGHVLGTSRVFEPPAG
jgi:hypothetical protein